MVDITLQIPDAKAPTVYDACADAFKDPNKEPTTAQKRAFIKKVLMDFLIDVTHAYNVRKAEEVARPVKDKTVVS